VTIQVSDPVAETLQYRGSSLPITVSLTDLRNICTSKTGNSLSYISFTILPSTDCGRLYVGYNGLNSGTQVTTGTSYYAVGSPNLRQLVFVPKAGFQGQTTIYYTGVDTRGGTYSGTISISVTPSSVSSRFSDMAQYPSAIPSVEFLYQNGVVNGVTSSLYSPASPITRAAFVTMLCRAFQFESAGTTSFPDVPSDSYYAQSVAAAKALGIVTGSNGLFLPDRQLTRQEAMTMLYRAMLAKGQTLPVSQSVLSAFSDADQVYPYARDAVSAMVQLGVVQGYSSGKLAPRNSITRAEMAVILHRVLTL
jgi:hypothetical protein